MKRKTTVILMVLLMASVLVMSGCTNDGANGGLDQTPNTGSDDMNGDVADNSRIGDDIRDGADEIGDGVRDEARDIADDFDGNTNNNADNNAAD